MDSWANAEWFLNRPEVPEKITVTVYLVSGETNTGKQHTAHSIQHTVPYSSIQY
jgi:aconitase B